MIEHRCQECGHFLRIPDTFAGKRGKCKYCRTCFTVPDGPFVPDPPMGTRGERHAPQEPTK
jgi:hypothetical protein